MKLSSYSVIKAVKSSSPNSRVDKVSVNINISGWGAVLLLTAFHIISSLQLLQFLGKLLIV